MGVIGVAPSHAQVTEWAKREQDLLSRGGLVMTPDAAGAVPGKGAAATQGLRTIPPRENGGNMDVKQITKGATLQLPVAVDGALFSVGDGHFAQGDGEVCVTAVEMGATAVVKFKVVKGAGKSLARGPRFRHRDYFAPPEWAAPAIGGVVNTPTSKAFKHFRASPSLNLARCRRASASILTLYFPRPRSASARARSINSSSCSTVSGSSRKTSERETSALLT